MIRIVLIIVLVFFTLRLLFRLFFPMILKHLFTKMSDRNNFNFNQNNEGTKREGDVTINYKPEDSQKKNNNKEDYIDFEEIK